MSFGKPVACATPVESAEPERELNLDLIARCAHVAAD
jgi:hypothetical protein